MPKGIQPIYSRRLSNIAYTVTFSNIPQNYTDLLLLMSARSSNASVHDSGAIYINGITSTGSYSFLRAEGNGSTISQSRNNPVDYMYFGTSHPAANATSNVFSSNRIFIAEYASNLRKQFLIDGVSENDGVGHQTLSSGMFVSNASITSLSIICGSGNFVANSTFTLYGIAR
jgi:hypothetical protein